MIQIPTSFIYFAWAAKISAILLLLSQAIYLTIKLTKDLHILQLNSYRNIRYWRWIKNHKRCLFHWSDLAPLLTFPAILIESTGLLARIVFILANILILLFYKHKPEKKPLVFTARVMRLYVTCLLVLSVIYLLFWFCLPYLTTLPAVLTFYLALILLPLISPLFLISVNLLVMPLEYIINNYYLNDAKKILAAFSDLTVIGVTGSFGKTSTKQILYEILRHQFNTLVTPGSYNTPMGITKVVRSSLKATHQIFVVEISAKQPGDIAEICALVKPRFGVITAIGEQHLETFKNLATIQKTKFELIEALPQNGKAFLNLDDANSTALFHLVKAPYVTFGIDNPKADYAALNITFDAAGTHFVIRANDNSQEQFQTKLLGKHNIYNILAAVAVAHELGISLKNMVYPIRQLQAVEHRLQLRKDSDGIIIIDDTFNSNPVGSKMALEVLAQISDKRKIIITPGMIELGEKEYELNYTLGKQIATVCNKVILVGKKQTNPLQAALNDQQFPQENIYVASCFNDAFKYWQSIKQPGDVVLLENDLPDNYNE